MFSTYKVLFHKASQGAVQLAMKSVFDVNCVTDVSCEGCVV